MISISPIESITFFKCSGRHDDILHSDDLIILEMDSQIETTSLIEYLAESNELKLTIRSGSIDEFGEMKINIRYHASHE